VARIILWFLGRGFQAAAALDHRIQEETAAWPESALFVIEAGPRGPALAMAKRGGRLVRAGSAGASPDLGVYFKSVEDALLVLTGQLGIDRAYAEHRFTMKGDIIAYGMPLVRCLYLVEAYLFPAFLTRRILKRMPRKATSSLRVYLKTLFAV
jgi:hypothetical protein